MNETRNIDISVLIPNYNGEGFIANCLESIDSQTTPLSIEVIIHDDYSTDHSVNIIESTFPKAILIRSKINVGFCVANNRMARRAKGKYLLLLNNDAQLMDNALSTLFDRAESKQNQSGIFSLPQYDWYTGEIIDYGMTNDFLLTPEQLKKPNPAKTTYVIGACMFLSKRLWKQADGFPEWMESIAEDMYLCMYAKCLGLDVECLDSSGFKHVYGKSFGGGKISSEKISTTKRRRLLSESNRIAVMLIFYPVATLLLLFPFALIMWLSEFLFISLLNPKTGFQIYVKSLLRIRENWTQIMATRRSLKQKLAIADFKAFSLTPVKLKYVIKFGLPSIK